MYRKPLKKVLSLFVLAMLISFCTKWYAVQDETLWQKDSEDLVWGRVVNATENGLLANGGFLGSYKSRGEFSFSEAMSKKPTGNFRVYDRQTGLQGTACALFTILAKSVGMKAYHIQRMLWTITAGMMIFAMMLLAKWLSAELGGGQRLERLPVLSWPRG